MSTTKRRWVLAIVSTLSSLASAQDTSTVNVATSASIFNTSSIFSLKKWHARYANYFNGSAFSEPKESSMNHYAQLKFDVKKDWALSGVFRADTTFEASGQKQSLADSYLFIGHPIYEAESGLKTFGEFRYFLPNSLESKQAKLAGIISPRVYTTQVYKRLEFINILIPKIFVSKASMSGQDTFVIGDYLAASYRPMKNFTLDFALNPEWTTTRGVGTTFNNLAAYPGFTVGFTKEISLSPYVELFLTKPEAKTASLGAYFNAAFL